MWKASKDFRPWGDLQGCCRGVIWPSGGFLALCAPPNNLMPYITSLVFLLAPLLWWGACGSGYALIRYLLLPAQVCAQDQCSPQWGNGGKKESPFFHPTG